VPPAYLILIGQPRILREIIANTVASGPSHVIVGEYDDARVLAADVMERDLLRRETPAPLVAVAANEQRLLVQRIEPVELPGAKTGSADLIAALERVSAMPEASSRA
jgi:hypothetical protein